MRQKIKRFLSILCMMTVIASMVTVMPVSAEEVQGSMTEREAVITESTIETEMEVFDTEIVDKEEGGTEQASPEMLNPEAASPEAVSTVAASTETVSEAFTYTDEQGNVFTYKLDEAGNATIIGITVSGAALIIPASVNEAPVIAVANGTSCVVLNPEVTIPELTINCHTIGAKAFAGLSIGVLTIDTEVKSLLLYNDPEHTYKYCYEQFLASKIDKVIFQATELEVGYVAESKTCDFFGPFYNASVGDLEIGSNVALIPELLFHGARMTLDTLELQTERIGAYAFCSQFISIGHLIIGENVKVYEEFSNSSPTFHHWQQFASCQIGTLTFLANELDQEHEQENNGTGSLYPPFSGATIGSLEIGSNITRFPELFLCNANISMEELVITQNRVGAYAFSGPGISIGTLVLDNTEIVFEESYYNTDLFHHFGQFLGSQIGTLKLYTPQLQLEKRLGKTSNSSIDAPFQGATVGFLEIGETVWAIPDYFLCGATMHMESLAIHTPVIGAKAFADGLISFGTLTIGESVTTFPESYYSKNIFHYWDQFQNCTIGHLIYGATAAEVVNDVEPIEGSSLELNGPFQGAVIEQFTLMENVTCIPDYFLKGATVSMEELYLDMPSIGTMAFRGANISIGKLTVEGSVEVFRKCPSGNDTFDYWEQFAYTTIGEVYYNVPDLELYLEE